MSSSPVNVLQAFHSFQESFNEENRLREKIRESVIELEQVINPTITTLQSIHIESSGDYSEVLAKAKEDVARFGKVYQTLASCVGGSYYRYHDHWKHVTQKAVFSVALIVFLDTQKLATKAEVAKELSLKADQEEGFHLDLEDYLHGLLQLVSELSRLAVNSAAKGHYSWPKIIANFVNELNAGFRLMNFKNDSLRKHYDCLKYDLKKIEEVVYDLSIRGLKPEEGNTDGTRAGEASSTK